MDAELCPGEELRWFAASSAVRQASVRSVATRQFAAWTAVVTAVSLLGLQAWSWSGPERLGWWAAFVLLAAWNAWQQSAACAVAVTNQRAFRLSLAGFGFRVDALDEVPADAGLTPADAAALELELAALRERQTSGEDVPAHNALIARDLPRDLREQVQALLHRGESLLWVDRPGARHYFMHAPLDLPTAGGIAAAIALFVAARYYGPVASLAAAGVGGFAAARLWRQVRGTVYALTDRRGLSLVPGREPRVYSVAEMRAFQRTQDGTGTGALTPPRGGLDEGFYGVRDVKALDDLLNRRTPRDRSAELVPAETPPGRGDEPTPMGDLP